MKKMLINAIHPEEIRVAVLDEGFLSGLFIESALKEQIKGNIYKGKISRVEPGLHAAFVEFGRERNGLLPINDINTSFLPGYMPDKDLIPQLRKGLEIIVQVNREEKDTKGALLTMNISLPGRYMVLLPKQDLAGISRKIEDESQRQQIKDIVKQLNVPENTGVIVRTAGMDRSKSDLSKDLTYLLKLWKQIGKDFGKSACPSLIYRESDVIIRSIRDYFTGDIQEILVDEEETYKKALEFVKGIMPRQIKLLKHYKETRPLFSKYELEKQIQNIYSRKVRLKSGSSIVIDQTEAMVTIDVNSGQHSEKDMEKTAFATNIEAVEEIARQIVLRDLAGLLVIDFIDMKEREHIRKVEKALKDSLKNDRAHITIGRISQFGLLALSRERLSPPLLEKSHIVCPYCEGTGMLRSVESASFMALREIHLYLNKSKSAKIRALLNEDVAVYILNQYRRYILKLEKDFSAEIFIGMNSSIKYGEIEIAAITD